MEKSGEPTQEALISISQATWISVKLTALILAVGVTLSLPAIVDMHNRISATPTQIAWATSACRKMRLPEVADIYVRLAPMPMDREDNTKYPKLQFMCKRYQNDKVIEADIFAEDPNVTSPK